MEITFWFVFTLVGWCYVGYPAVMWVRARRFQSLQRSRVSADYDGEPVKLPPVSVVLAVRNEAHRVEGRIRNLLDQQYPADHLEVIVVCNGCTDGTEALVEEMRSGEPRIQLLQSPSDEGKAGALNLGVQAAKGEVILFADARQRFRPDALRHLVQRLADPAVGAVSGRLVIEPSRSPSLEGVRRYWDLETQLRLAESATGSVVGVTGAIYAMKRRLFRPLPPGLILDDLYVPLRVVAEGHRVVLEPDAVAVDMPAPSQGAEFRRKVRTMVGNLQLLRKMPRVILPWENPLWLRYVSHKLLRLATPILLVTLILLGFAIDGMIYRAVAAIQLCFYVLGAVGLMVPLQILQIPAAFLLMHGALAVALFKGARGADTVWEAPPRAPTTDDSKMTSYRGGSIAE